MLCARCGTREVYVYCYTYCYVYVGRNLLPIFSFAANSENSHCQIISFIT